MALLKVSCIQKNFGAKSILDEVHFELKTGKILGVFGRNGSGKSTLLKILFGTQTAEAGRLKMNESYYPVRKNIWHKSRIIESQQIGYLPQFSFLPKGAKVWDVIPQYLKGQEQDLVFQAPRMPKIAGRKVGELSMGERRYLEVLLIGNLDHPFLLLDEPFSMVEPLFKDLIHEFLVSLKAKKGILITDHYYHDVWQLSDRKMVLTSGKLTPITELEELIKAGYLRSIN
ncbi:ATP-binding cassette domain-containing protein [Leeuwenhoekiella nanhaiensis]|uniref:ABC transporter ATP-binding protein n=1 Tax=Leeuwenhoekiella nanhaiensis TaxID=1655491 RepID=A0A2G1VS05_9FLAO|nr:ATP-binding cassette domain-containing protein [Leeuwenhoekiella nanhaiensis]PHQ29239.1 ABC transporter ATP-binding protein [Leeuwenhoekiella nanhaiensis]